VNEDQRILNEAREAAAPKSSGIGAIIGSVAFFGFLWYVIHNIYALDGRFDTDVKNADGTMTYTLRDTKGSDTTMRGAVWILNLPGDVATYRQDNKVYQRHAIFRPGRSQYLDRVESQLMLTFDPSTGTPTKADPLQWTEKSGALVVLNPKVMDFVDWQASIYMSRENAFLKACPDQQTEIPRLKVFFRQDPALSATNQTEPKNPGECLLSSPQLNFKVEDSAGELLSAGECIGDQCGAKYRMSINRVFAVLFHRNDLKQVEAMQARISDYLIKHTVQADGAR
jgi:hypothetical protein